MVLSRMQSKLSDSLPVLYRATDLRIECERHSCLDDKIGRHEELVLIGDLPASIRDAEGEVSDVRSGHIRLLSRNIGHKFLAQRLDVILFNVNLEHKVV